MSGLTDERDTDQYLVHHTETPAGVGPGLYPQKDTAFAKEIQVNRAHHTTKRDCHT